MEVSIIDDHVLIEFNGHEKIWALKHTIALPLKNIKGAHTRRIEPNWTTIRMGGTAIPGFAAGRFWTKRDKEWCKEFWYYSMTKPQVVIELKAKPIYTFLDCFRGNIVE